jgi:hypothetical protein
MFEWVDLTWVVRAVGGSLMAVACGVNLYVFFVILNRARGWRRVTYPLYAISVATAAGVNAYIRLSWGALGLPLSFPDWQALVLSFLYLAAGIAGAISITLWTCECPSKIGWRRSRYLAHGREGEPPH